MMRDMSSGFTLSVVIPVYNEEKGLDHLFERLVPVLRRYTYELIFVDDGSKDRTVSIIKHHARTNKHIKMLGFNRNFGHQMALACGYAHARGDCVVTMDADLQDPPELIHDMIVRWQKGAKVVYARRKKRDYDTPFKKWTAHFFYMFMNVLSDSPIPQDVGDYRLLDKGVVRYLNRLSEKPRFLRGLVAWAGYPAEYVYFKRDKRVAGKTHYTFSKMFNFALEGIVSFSIKPLRWATFMGFATATLGFVGIIYTIARKLISPEAYVIGWPALFVTILFMGGVQLLTIGIIGEYIGKMYQEIQGRPHYIVDKHINV